MSIMRRAKAMSPEDMVEDLWEREKGRRARVMAELRGSSLLNGVQLPPDPDEATQPLSTRKFEAATRLTTSTFCHPRSNIRVSAVSSFHQQRPLKALVTWKAKVLDVLLAEPKPALKRQCDVPWIGVRSGNLM